MIGSIIRPVLGLAWLCMFFPGAVIAQTIAETPPPAGPGATVPPPAVVDQEAAPLAAAHPADQDNHNLDGSATIPILSAQRGGMAGWMNPTLGQVPLRSDFRFTWFPSEKTSAQGTSLGSEQYNFSLSFPVWQDCVDEWSGNVHLRSEAFQTDAFLPSTGQPFPAELWNIHAGTSYRHLFDNGWIGGASVNVGSASDKPFATFNEITASASAFLRVPQGEHNAWLFSLSLSTNSEVLAGIPIPGVAYFYAPTDWFQATIGFPFASVVYRPEDDLTLQLTYALLTNFHVKATYRLARPLRIYAGFDIENENYFLVDRPAERDRFFYYDKRLTAGLQWQLGRNASLDFSSGYLFDRFYFEGKNSNDRSFNRIDVGDGPFVAFQVNVRY
jgi:hypothetical protein